jgi:hypothetical protein
MRAALPAPDQQPVFQPGTGGVRNGRLAQSYSDGLLAPSPAPSRRQPRAGTGSSQSSTGFSQSR